MLGVRMLTYLSGWNSSTHYRKETLWQQNCVIHSAWLMRIHCVVIPKWVHTLGVYNENLKVFFLYLYLCYFLYFYSSILIIHCMHQYSSTCLQVVNKCTYIEGTSACKFYWWWLRQHDEKVLKPMYWYEVLMTQFHGKPLLILIDPIQGRLG